MSFYNMIYKKLDETRDFPVSIDEVEEYLRMGFDFINEKEREKYEKIHSDYLLLKKVTVLFKFISLVPSDILHQEELQEVSATLPTSNRYGGARGPKGPFYRILSDSEKAGEMAKKYIGFKTDLFTEDELETQLSFDSVYIRNAGKLQEIVSGHQRNYPNDDKRGRDELDKVFPWPSSGVHLEHPTVYEVISGMVFAKSHKFENNYELYLRSEIRLGDGGVEIYMVTDYGS